MGFRIFSAILGICSFAFSQLSFTTSPSFTANGGTWTIAFTLSDSTDVEVSIVSLKDSVVVRHLAAGMLGSNPPAPLQANSLSQTLAWDGRDDLGVQVVDTESLTVRVRAGMSADFKRFVGGNPYAFRDENSGYWSFNGMSKGENGEVYVSGSSEPQQFATIRAYDGSGNYVRTVFPFRGDFQPAEVSGFGVNNWLNGSYSPRFAGLAGPSLTGTILSSFNGYSMLPINGPGEVAVGGGKGLNCLKFNSNGSIASGAAQVGLVTSPALPNHYFTFGPIYLNLAHRADVVYLSGYHQAASVDAGCHFVLAADTGFWRDGCVYRIDMSTGVATQFITLDSVTLQGQIRDMKLGGPSDFFTAIHSVKADAQGRVFVCDRFNKEIGVYDSNGVKLGAISDVANPDQIALDPATGAIYVACRSGWHYDAKPLYLKKFSGWGPSDSLVFSANLWLNYGESGVHLIIQQGISGPMVWIANGDVGVRIYQDQGDTVSLFKDFYATKVNNLGFDRIGVDRRTETVYINNGDPHIYKITDWANPSLVRCSTSANQKLYASDFCISYDGQFYTRGGTGFSGPIERWTLDGLHAPIPFANTGTNQMCMQIYGRMGVMYGDKGLAVSPLDKHVAFMQMHNFASYWVDTLEAEGTNDTVTWTGGTPEWMPRTILHMNTGGMGGVKFDLKGNLYVGGTILPAGHRVESSFTTDFLYPRGAGGAVVKYAPGDTGTVTSGTAGTATNGTYVYKSNLGPMSGHGACQCRSSRFDVDPYGRLFIPSGVTQQVSVVDNNDNVILTYGRYGNWDEQGSGSNIPFACPLAVAASENFMYVNDLINTRLAQVEMKYELDNMPGFLPLGVKNEAPAGVSTTLMSRPDPFNPESRVTFTLAVAANVDLSVYDLSGRLVKTLARGAYKAGVHSTVWSAENARGGKVSAGVYVYRLTAGKQVLVKKTILAK